MPRRKIDGQRHACHSFYRTNDNYHIFEMYQLTFKFMPKLLQLNVLAKHIALKLFDSTPYNNLTKAYSVRGN